MSDDKPSVSAAPTPDGADELRRFINCSVFNPPTEAIAHAHNELTKLLGERDEARRGFERMSDTCFAAIRRAEAAEKELAAAKEQLAAERKRADALQADMDKIREAYEAMKNG